MSYHHKTIFISLITTVVVFILYSIYMYNKYLNRELVGEEGSIIVGQSTFLLIGASIVVTIIVHILYAIIEAIITQKEPDSDTFADERDKLIDYKGLQIFIIVFGIGFALAMGALSLGTDSPLVFLLITLSMFLANLISEISKLFYYHFGV